VKRSPAGLSTFRVGDAPKRGEGLRIGVTRRPPRGVPREKWASEGYFDVWYPYLAPSGCFCEDESRCHRSRLFIVLSKEAEHLAVSGKGNP
jgi:uncharacterized protein YeaO (DUF488 family)